MFSAHAAHSTAPPPRDNPASRWPILQAVATPGWAQESVSFIDIAVPPITDLTAGAYALSDVDLFELNHRIYLRIEALPNKQSNNNHQQVFASVDQIGPYFCSELAHARALWYAERGNFKAAEKYHKIAMKLLKVRDLQRFSTYSEARQEELDFRKRVAASYAFLLYRLGRHAESFALSSAYQDKPLARYPINTDQTEPKDSKKGKSTCSRLFFGVSIEKDKFPDWNEAARCFGDLER